MGLVWGVSQAPPLLIKCGALQPAIPFAPQVLCCHRGAEWQEAEVIAIKEGAGPPFLYYIHFVGFDRRLDRWVPEAEVWRANL